MNDIQLFNVIVVAALGIIYGSFATALIHRIPAGISWGLPDFRFSRKTDLTADSDPVRSLVPRSACPACHHVLSFLDLIPVFSWIFLRGRCRFCKVPIGWTYPATELITAAACFLVYSAWDLNIVSLLVMTVVPFLIAMAVIDVRHLILPNILNIILAVLWGLFIIARAIHGQALESLWTYIWTSVLSGILYGCLAWGLGMLMKMILKKETLGFGDVKFFAVAGLWLGFAVLPAFLMISGILGVLIGMVYRIMIKEIYFPFGPALMGAFFILLLLSRPVFLS